MYPSRGVRSVSGSANSAECDWISSSRYWDWLVGDEADSGDDVIGVSGDEWGIEAGNDSTGEISGLGEDPSSSESGDSSREFWERGIVGVPSGRSA